MADEFIPIDKTKFPFTTAKSSMQHDSTLLSALLATNVLDEVSNIDDFDGVRKHIVAKGRVDEGGNTTVGTAFWVYPSGLHGPFHLSEHGVVHQHGALVTVESGVPVEHAIRRAKAALQDSRDRHVVLHEHIANDA